jgi:hypothetical protein
MYESDLRSGILNTPNAALLPAAPQAPVNFLASLQNGSLSPLLSSLVQNTAQNTAAPNFTQDFLNSGSLGQVPIQVIIINGSVPGNGLNGLPLNLNSGAFNNGAVLNTQQILPNSLNAQQIVPQMNAATASLAQANAANALNAVQLGTIFGNMDTDHNLSIDQKEFAAAAATLNGDPLNLAPLLAAGGGTIAANAFLNRFIQLDTNHDEQWTPDELAASAGQNNPSSGLLPQNADQPQGTSGIQILPPGTSGVQVSPQANAGVNAALPNFQNDAGGNATLPNFPPEQSSPAAPGTGKPGLGDNPNGDAPLSPNAAGTDKAGQNNDDAADSLADLDDNSDTTDLTDPKIKDAKAKGADNDAAAETGSDDAAITAVETEKNIKLRNDRWERARKMAHAEKESVSLIGLHNAMAGDDKIFDEKEYNEYVQMLGLKTSYADFDKSRKAGLSEDKALAKAVGDVDSDHDGELANKEFIAANPLLSDKDAADIDLDDKGTNQPSENPIDAAGKTNVADKAATPSADEDKAGKTVPAPAAEKPARAQGRPGYFEINGNNKRGVEKDELETFLGQFADNDKKDKLSAEAVKRMIENLGWEKSRYAQRFLKQLRGAKDGMTVKDIVALMFDRLDGDKGYKYNYGLVQGELGDLVTGTAGHKHKSKKRHR